MRNVEDKNNTPLEIYKKIERSGKLTGRFFIWACGAMSLKEEKLNVDYTKWLGKDYP